MRCRKAQRLIFLDLDDELDNARRVVVSDHLAGCARCRAFAAGLDASGEALSTWPAPDPRPGFAGRTRARIANLDPAQGSSPGWQEFLKPAPLGLGAAAFCIGVVLAVLANGRQPTEPPAPGQGPEALANGYVAALSEDPVEASLLALLPQAED